MIKTALVALAGTTLCGCIEEIDPQSSTVTKEQVLKARGAYDNLVSAITSSLNGEFFYSGNDGTDPYDFGYPSFFLQRDVMGQDIACEDSGSEWYTTWYCSFSGLAPTTGRCQLPWSYYYNWIKNCNIVLSMIEGEPTKEQKVGAGIAHTMRAMFYHDLARMYAQKPYGVDKSAPTVPIINEKTTIEESQTNARATNEVIYKFILDDLNAAEPLLADYKRSDVYTPDLSVVYGLKARVYLDMQDWANAEKYAKLAQEGYTMLTKDEYLSQTSGFNKPNEAWLFGLTYRSTDPNITLNDADSSWGSQMIIEVVPSECGYSSNYVGPKRIDAHLYSTIPQSDFRRMCFIDPAIDEIYVEGASDEETEALTQEAQVKALAAYSDDPEGLWWTGYNVSARESVGYMPVKFRPKDGVHDNQYTAFTVAVPLMRVEEMKLIEAEAAGMQDEARGIQLLTEFAKTRDANYTYGTHNEAYGNTATSAFQNEVWWQRRVEFWGEGFATFDIKRLQKGIIRSYEGTNHPMTMRWNTQTTPQWMNLCIIQTETNYNGAIENNPTPIAPTGDSEPFAW